jgi:lysophospholipid acyltransferase (LPLAT)-like uncharacterized protein
MASIKERLSGSALYWLAQLTCRTARYQVAGAEHFEASQAAGPVIFVAWHGMTMMLAGFFLGSYDSRRLVLIVPDDWRGTTLSIWATKVGAQPFPLNLKEESSMASARRLARLMRLVRHGRDCYITPDGPDGPAYLVKPGVAYLAQKSGATLLPMGAYTGSGYRLKRWDHYVVPYPYSRISLVIGSPLEVKAGGYTAALQPLTEALHGVTTEAVARYYNYEAP